MHSLANFLLTACLSPFAVVAQDIVTIPAGHSTLEGDGRSTIPGLGIGGHQQFVIGSSQAQSLLGRAILGLRFRQDANWPEAMNGGTADILVRMGTASAEPLDVTADFASNAPNAIVVFQGALTVPNAAAVTGPLPFAAPYLVGVDFPVPYVHHGGPLAIEIECTNLPNGEFWWVIDGVHESVAGTVTHEGTACGPRVPPNGQTAEIAATSLVGGGTLESSVLGQANAMALFVLGTTTRPAPLDLAFLGAPGCELRVDILAATPRPIPATGEPGFGPTGHIRLGIPGDPAFIGTSLAAQWLEVGASITASQTMRATIAARLPALGLTTLTRYSDGSVAIEPSQAPVFGFVLL